jgi:hypothetical protein
MENPDLARAPIPGQANVALNSGDIPRDRVAGSAWVSSTRSAWNGCAVAFQELSILVRRYSGMSIQFNFTPELHLVDGRIIRNIEDAIAFAREQEARPGVDRRDEVLHALERARGREEAHAAAHLFLRWLEELEIVD